MRWVLIQCTNVNVRYGEDFKKLYIRIKRKKGHNVAVVAVARKLLEVIGHILKGEGVFKYLEAGKYAKKVLNFAWDLGREKNLEKENICIVKIN